MTRNVFMTDYGPVSVSECEARVLEMAEQVRSAGMAAVGTTIGGRLLARERCLIAACERVAKFKSRTA